MFIEKLKAAKKNLKASSITTYERNIRRLYKASGGEGAIPEKDHKWINKKSLVAWYKEQPLSVRRHMSNAAIIALQVYKKKSKQWQRRQKTDMQEFDANRNKRELSDKQKSKIPAKGFESLKTAVNVMKKELKHVIDGIETKQDLLRVQDLVILSLYSELPLRLDFATLKLERGDSNSIFKSKRKPTGWTIELKEFKTVSSMGPKKFRLSQGNQRLLNKFVPAVKKITEHGYLLTNKSGGKMSKQVLSKTLMRITKHRIGKAFSSQLIRILYAMSNRGVIESAKEVNEKLLHSAKQSLQYAKKEEEED